MPDDTGTAVADPPAKAETPPDPAADSDAKAADAKAVEAANTPQEYVIHPDNATRISLKPGEKDWLAGHGFKALEQTEAARLAALEKPKEPESEPEKQAAVQPEDAEDDAATQRVAQLETKLAKAQEALDGITQREEARERNQQVQEREDAERTMLNELARQHGIDAANPVDRRMVEHRANDLANEAVKKKQVRTFASCYEEAKGEIGERLAKGGRAWLADKKAVADKSAEPPGGVSTAELPATAAPRNKTEERQLVAEMEDGTVTERAHARFNQMLARENV